MILIHSVICICSHSPKFRKNYLEHHRTTQTINCSQHYLVHSFWIHFYFEIHESGQVRYISLLLCHIMYFIQYISCVHNKLNISVLRNNSNAIEPHVRTRSLLSLHFRLCHLSPPNQWSVREGHAGGR
jgi:hypothetical protein